MKEEGERGCCIGACATGQSISGSTNPEWIPPQHSHEVLQPVWMAAVRRGYTEGERETYRLYLLEGSEGCTSHNVPEFAQ